MPLRTSSHRKQASGRWLGRNSKRREVLSVNMISRPLGDFRHVTHIGGDAHADSFGDLSFLKMGHNLLLKSSQSEQNIFMACSPPPKPPRLNLDEPHGSESPEWRAGGQHIATQRRKKCSSLPLLDDDDDDIIIEEIVKGEGHQRGVSGAVPCGGARSPAWGSVSSDKDGDSPEICDRGDGRQKDEESGFSFSLDLGPSILDDVLQVMEKLHY